jgi:hypothetical protein
MASERLGIIVMPVVAFTAQRPHIISFLMSGFRVVLESLYQKSISSLHRGVGLEKFGFPLVTVQSLHDLPRGGTADASPQKLRR